ncbi:MAG TPA: hypothetical protein VI142_02740 [Gaiellaceae bacterium]
MINRMAIVFGVAAVAAIAIVANLALLGYASAGNDPVGKLKPQARIPNAPTAPASVIRPRVGRVTDEGADD